MTEDEKKLKVATFRFGIISEFVNGLRFSYGEREKFIKDKISRSYEIPYSAQKTISRTTIEKWIYDYKYAGNRIEGLYPRTRTDKGKSRALTSSLKLAITEFKKENPKIKLPALITTLRHKKLIGQDEYVHSSSVYRYIKSQELNTVNENAVDKRLFEAEHPNEIWQSDVMHGPYVKVEGKLKKSYLIAIIDDHSRFIVHAEFYLNETRENLLDTLKQAILKRGLPQVLYIDNGSCFKALHLEQVTAQLGIAIKHSRPYTPQGRGKIERWFKYVRDHFLSVNKLTVTSPDKLDLLNYNFSNWVDEYNNRVHGSTKQKPYDRYCAGLECVRPAPAYLINYFRQIEFRRVKKDRTVRIKGGIYEVPVSLIDRRVALHFHPEDLSNIEIYFNEKSYGMAVFVNPHINSKIGRNWDTGLDIKKDKKEFFEADAAIATGKLFESRSAQNRDNEEGKVVL